MIKKTITLILIIIFFITSGQNQEKTTQQILDEEQKLMETIQETNLNEIDKIADEFSVFQKKISDEYLAIEKAEKERIEKIEKKILEKWNDYGLSNKDEYFNYDEDLRSRGRVNFKEGKIKIEVILPVKDDNKKIASEKIQNKLKDLIEEKGFDNQSIINKQLKDKNNKTLNENNIKDYSNDIVKTIKKENLKGGDGKNRIKYTVTLKMVPNHLQIRLSRYKDEILKQSRRFNLDPALVCAMIHTESHFNPKARSHVPAYGLMQLVPQSGARDAYNYLYKKDKLVSANYLYNSQNNIELGCAYLAKLRYKYFKKVKDNQKAKLCIICAYNTGAGNVALAISGKKTLGITNDIVNRKSVVWVDNKLMKDLPYSETKHYLTNVKKRHQMYLNIF